MDGRLARSLAACAALATIVASGMPPAAAQTAGYTVTDLGTLGGARSRA